MEAYMEQENKTQGNTCRCVRYKETPRNAEHKKRLQNRLNRLIGQLNGIKTMVETDRYCGDILIQLAAVEKALEGVGYEILEDHLQSCVSEKLKRGETDVISETVGLIRKLK